MLTDIRIQSPPTTFRADEQLIRDCLDGREEAWTELIDKYKTLIFSVPVKYGFSREEATDIFQDVCCELLSQLKNLREPRALPKWLLRVTTHRCFHSRRRTQRMLPMDSQQLEWATAEAPPSALEVVADAEEEQEVRAAIASLSNRGQQLVKMLFFEDPPRPYQEVAKALGVATGSVGFLRQRCLSFLRREIQKISKP
jgi:RNA polymerase sigma factor (sigma-70 family)